MLLPKVAVLDGKLDAIILYAYSNICIIKSSNNQFYQGLMQWLVKFLNLGQLVFHLFFFFQKVNVFPEFVTHNEISFFEYTNNCNLLLSQGFILIQNPSSLSYVT